MKVNVGGNQYFVDVHHIDSKITLGGVETPCRATKITLEIPNAKAAETNSTPLIAETFTYCSPQEQFSRREGRRRAVDRLLKLTKDMNYFDKTQRGQLFRQVCPEYFKNENAV